MPPLGIANSLKEKTKPSPALSVLTKKALDAALDFVRQKTNITASVLKAARNEAIKALGPKPGQPTGRYGSSRFKK